MNFIEQLIKSRVQKIENKETGLTLKLLNPKDNSVSYFRSKGIPVKDGDKIYIIDFINNGDKRSVSIAFHSDKRAIFGEYKDREYLAKMLEDIPKSIQYLKNIFRWRRRDLNDIIFIGWTNTDMENVAINKLGFKKAEGYIYIC